MKTYEQAAIEIMTSADASTVWFGDPDLWGSIFRRKNGHNDRHPLDQWYAVYAALRRSEKFECVGHVNAPGWSTCREIEHPAFKLRQAT